MGSWDTRESSGLLDDFDLYVENAHFGYDAQYGDACLFILEGRSPQGDPENEYQVRQYYSVGSGWEPAKGGAEASHPDTDEFHASTNYSRFFRAVLELSETASKTLQDRGYPNTATIWNGLAFHMERQEVDYGGDFGKRKVLLPTAYLGEEDFPGAGGGKATTAKAKAAAAKAKAAKAGTGGDLRSKVVELASAHDDHDAFLEAMFTEFPEIESEDIYADAVDVNGEIWAEAHA